MAKKYGVASDYIKYTSRIKSDTSDGVAVEASQVVDLEEDKLQSDINKELKASIASASGKTYSKSEIDGKDTATLTSAKSYADTKKTEAVNAAATDATTKANTALASAKSYADQKVSSLGSVYTTKGSCTAAQLKALTSAKAGDVWNITDAISIDGKAYPAGVNVVCVTAFSAAIDPATTKNWDALQGVQDLTPYAKKSEIESEAIANVKFTQEELGQEKGVSFKKTITYVNGRETDTDFGLAIDPATSSKAGVMSAADKVKLDAVDGRIRNMSIERREGVYRLWSGDRDVERVAIINEGANIGQNADIKEGVFINKSVNIGANIEIRSESNGRGFSLFKSDETYSPAIGTSWIGGDVFIGSGVYLSTSVQIGTISGTPSRVMGFRKDESNLGFGWEPSAGKLMWSSYNTDSGEFEVETAVSKDEFDSNINLLNSELIDIKDNYALSSDLYSLQTRVSALEDLLKLA